ncbi:MAG: hypothetical protein MRY74_15285 [Neomegalonema sp.]|nr:hypothetical protein [Neomegalonema sp.]
MSLMNAVEIARDFAGFAALVLFGLFAALLWMGAINVSVSLAAAIAAAALGAVGAIAFYGLLAAAGLGGVSIGLLGLALMLLGGFLSAQYYGVRGFWVFWTVAAGVGFGAMLLVLVHRGAAPVGPFMPILAVAVLTLVVFGALGVVASQTSAREDRRFRLAVTDLTTPPEWFDCAYATFGGTAEKPAHCPFTPPKVVGAPSWAVDPKAPEATDAALAADARAAAEGVTPLAAADAPKESAAPKTKDLSTPSFDTAPGDPARPGEAPKDVAAPAVAKGADEARKTDSRDDRGKSVEAPKAPAPLPPSAVADPSAPKADAPESAKVETASALPAAKNMDSAPASPSRPEASRSAFVCFSALGAAAQRLCPDQSLSERDLEVSWRDKDGAAIGKAGSIECYFDPALALHVTTVVHVSGALAAEMPRDKAASGAMRRADAIYQMLTRLAGAARAGARSDQDKLFLSMYLIGGSPLREPWAEQSFGDGMADRLFDIRSTPQTLSFLRYLKLEIEALNAGTLRGDLASGVNAVIKGRPKAPFEVGESVILLLVDATEAGRLEKEAAIKLGDSAKAAGAPVYVIQIGEDRGHKTLEALAERSGGALIRAEHAEALEETIERTLRRARSFCAVRVTAPESFFKSGSVELRLRRKLEGSCELEQLAVVDCAGIKTTERISTDGL